MGAACQSLPLGSLDLCFLTDKVLMYSCHKLTMLPLTLYRVPLAPGLPLRDCLERKPLDLWSLISFVCLGATPCNGQCLLLALCPVFSPGRAWRTL